MIENNVKVQIGRLVLAKAGRDKGDTFVVIEQIDPEYVLIVNGINRTMEKPKKKKIKHLEFLPYFLHNIREKIVNGQKVFDAEIRKNLETFK